MFPSYRNQSIDLQTKSTDWFLHDRNIGCYKVKEGNVCWQLVYLEKSRKRFLEAFVMFSESLQNGMKKYGNIFFLVEIFYKNDEKYLGRWQTSLWSTFSLKLVNGF